ncbi:MAG: response regulator [Desulfovibrionales bacterium]|nr:response regulator [Desulfovibrionales bacterium]
MADTAPQKILVVDDDKLTLDILTSMLERDGYQVTPVAGGKEALASLGREFYNLILTDLVMDGMDGLTLLKEAKKISPESVVLMITGHSSVETAVNAMYAGAMDYILKPCEQADLLFKVQRALDRQQLGRIAKEKEKQDALLDLVRGLADTLNNRITTVVALGDLALEHLQHSEVEKARDRLKSVVEAALRVTEVVNELLMVTSYVKKEELFTADIPFIFSSLRKKFAPFTIKVTGDGQTLSVKALSNISLAFEKIVQNAVEAMDGQGSIEVNINRIKDQDMVEIRFIDQGSGITREDIPRVFLPFFTTKGTQSPGLGLWTAYQIVTGANGTIHIESEAGKGTTVVVRLPVAGDQN